MRNFKMILQYEGTRYKGWQRQESTEHTIQGKLESILTKMAGAPVEIQGSGRTDAGVHALGQVANFHADIRMSEQEIMNYVNSYLPEDIAVISVKEASERFHSRLNATGKTYCYLLVQSGIPHVFERRFAHRIEERLDVEAMEKAAGYLLGTHDFAAFTSTKKSKKSTVRTIDEITFTREYSSVMHIMTEVQEPDLLRITYSGDGFLYHMVRILTGTLMEVGMQLRSPEEIPEILKSKNREMAGPLVPAKGLTLMEVRYS
ncbi:MAG: tRNA pseudouridine(38-40) synthase TruA [Lachnospiraceae bacterium]|jgi:tRNA pseudouridine38-40 synthase|nr:MAG: tRNA pseudouridine(38-40) synthase TruA [Lachnospiraceae bacterium]